MHKLTSRPLAIDDFSYDDPAAHELEHIDFLNDLIREFKNPDYSLDLKEAIWRQLIQNLPMSFNYTRTWTADYQNLRNIYFARKNHKLSEWHTLCGVIETLPAAELITIKPWWQNKIDELEQQLREK
jgi:hypothetical protein